MIAASLSRLEMVLVTGVGHVRARNARRVGAADRTHSADPLAMDVGAAAAEYVVARYLDRFWNALADEFAGSLDVGRGRFGVAGQWDVKWTRNPNGGLRVRPTNDPRTTFVLVVGEPPDLTIVGALDGARCRDARYWRGDNWIVPQSDLFEWKDRP